MTFSRRIVGAGAAVVALHAALWWLVSATERPERPPRAQRTSVVIVALPPPRRDTALAVPTPPIPAKTPSTSTSLRRERTPTATPPATADATPVVPPSSPGSTRAAADAGPGASQPAAPLDLRWHGGAAWRASRQPALDDPRSNSAARATPEERMARRTDDTLREEMRGEGHVRVRRGESCIDLDTTRASELFAGEGTTRPLPRLASSCD